MSSPRAQGSHLLIAPRHNQAYVIQYSYMQTHSYVFLNTLTKCYAFFKLSQLIFLQIRVVCMYGRFLYICRKCNAGFFLKFHNKTLV